MLAEGMASLLIRPPLLGISWVPPSISFSWCGVAAHAERPAATTTAAQRYRPFHMAHPSPEPTFASFPAKIAQSRASERLRQAQIPPGPQKAVERGG
jgi:hypothetical protein